MLRCVIICGGEIDSYDKAKAQINSGDKIICADYGYIHAKNMGLKPDAVVGDFDSVKKTEVACDNIVEVPAKKDFTDTELAIEYAKERGYSEILLVGALGGRADHAIVNITLLKKIMDIGIKGCIYDGKSYIYMTDSGMQLSGNKGDLLTLIPVTGVIEGITTYNLEYPLREEDMEYGSTRGISNVFLDKTVRVEWKNGNALIVHTPMS